VVDGGVGSAVVGWWWQPVAKKWLKLLAAVGRYG